MDRAEAIAFFESKKTALEKSEHILLGRNAYDAFCSAVDALREQEERKWISVEERLPDKTNADEKGLVIAIAKGELPKLWYLDVVMRYKQEFTHWMPLPEPPKD